jgi:hypothetical protein
MNCLMCNERELFAEGICDNCIMKMVDRRKCIFPNCKYTAMRHFSTCFKHFVKTNQMYEMIENKVKNMCTVRGCHKVSL